MGIFARISFHRKWIEDQMTVEDNKPGFCSSGPDADIDSRRRRRKKGKKKYNRKKHWTWKNSIWCLFIHSFTMYTPVQCTKISVYRYLFTGICHCTQIPVHTNSWHFEVSWLWLRGIDCFNLNFKTPRDRDNKQSSWIQSKHFLIKDGPKPSCCGCLCLG